MTEPLEGQPAVTPPAPATPVTLTPSQESGLGRLTVLPPELRGWSWGAFFFTWLWGIFNGAYITLWGLLLAFIPGGALIWAIVCGVKGREWAWKGKYWESAEAFKLTQRNWAIAGVICSVLGVVIFLLFLLPVMSTMLSS